ncbi:D-alanyl-D-alanine carboxypeptidase [Echinicola jeungdonensis]|uniref:D-alanyl-D-alanine carboxypeptidase/D-alanyl-D-alanine-endopeptidase n=1 Tax=Echinicola jeungdonensis TaxID=709343 RepID=A0ABV5JA79_9BACT|nr:D-alanyl-D-alanine carboxypeptidase [Echinicola jeungdonensis]MDN3669905.1 D-alanyl-D-alanine carboxypeptidase [Echinicola jeungdonensis]
MARKHCLLFFLLLVSPLFLFGQSTVSERYKGLDQLLDEDSFFGNHLTGVMLYDLDEQTVQYEKNSHLYFIPASTTKLFTFFAGYVVLNDSTSLFRYVPNGNEVTIWGTGDPSWKYEVLPQPELEGFFKKFDKIYFSDENWKDTPMGYGWQWDDYYYSYAAERSPFPIYGNLAKVKNIRQNFSISPGYFENKLKPTNRPLKKVERDPHTNLFYYNPSTCTLRESKVPFLTSPEIFSLLASQELGKEVIPVKKVLPEEHYILKGIPLRALYKEMLQESDNFLAEQLLLMISDQIFKELDITQTIDFLKKNFLSDLPDEPQWVDGSGLSRHNLITPRSMVALIEKIYRVMPDNLLFDLLPRGGVNGTLENSYKSSSPYIFAKTGTMSNNHALAGFIKTDSGKLYAFAFMNNNYPYKATQVRKEMEKVLQYIRDNF